MKLFERIIKPVYAHCDLPCGIYETDTMRHAADTCLKMIEKVEDMGKGQGEVSNEHNNFIRAVMIKEKHAQLCKDQIYVLWSDYFKPEHVERFPELHEKLWQTAKQCSKVKQSFDRAECEKLISMVAEVNELFAKSHEH